MAFVLRTWICQNAECHEEFEAGEPSPRCPVCGCMRVQWCPSGGHILSGATRSADATLRRVAANYGLTNLRSARAGEAAHPGRPAPKFVREAAPVQLGNGLGVKLTERPYSEFQNMSVPLRGQVPIGGRYKRGAKPPPAKMNYRHRDDRDAKR